MVSEKFLKTLIASFSLITVSYLYYIKKSYKYLKKLGYDGPKPMFFIGNLADFASKENSIHKDLDDINKPVISHYSKTLRRWTKQFGKIYGYYEGHEPVLVLADPDLVEELFLNQNKLLSYRRSFPMSKSSSDPNADVFVSNGIRWMRVRYGLEKIMLNNKNAVRCLEYANNRFFHLFNSQIDLNKPQHEFNIQNRIRLFMIETMFNVIFGTNLETFINETSSILNGNKKKLESTTSNNSNKVGQHSLYHTQIVAHRFNKAFLEYESFSILKFMAITFSEAAFLWRAIDKFKRLFSSHVYAFSCLADPMDWFVDNFINKHMQLYSANNIQEKNISDRQFSYLNSFLYLTYNPIFKYNQNESVSATTTLTPVMPTRRFSSLKQNLEYRKRAYTTTDFNSINENILSHSMSDKKFRCYSNDFGDIDNRKKHLQQQSILSRSRSRSYLSSSYSTLDQIETSESESWTLTVNEALNNSLLMFFAGYETTSSAIGFCCHVLTKLPEQKAKLLEELNEYSKKLAKFDLNKNLDADGAEQKNFFNESDELALHDEKNENESETSLEDDVFEDDHQEKLKNKAAKKSTAENFEQMNELNNILEQMKYLDMFVKEVLRMFPIANSMVSRKCMIDDLYIDNGNYYIPKNMNVVVDVLSIHYDPVIWGPVDPEIFYPERFLTKRNPTGKILYFYI
jgi:hypothetical protein